MHCALHDACRRLRYYAGTLPSTIFYLSRPATCRRAQLRLFAYSATRSGKPPNATSAQRALGFELPLAALVRHQFCDFHFYRCETLRHALAAAYAACKRGLAAGLIAATPSSLGHFLLLFRLPWPHLAMIDILSPIYVTRAESCLITSNRRRRAFLYGAHYSEPRCGQKARVLRAAIAVLPGLLPDTFTRSKSARPPHAAPIFVSQDNIAMIQGFTHRY